MERDHNSPNEPKAPEWQYRGEGFAINQHMRQVIQATIALTQSEIDRYRKKLNKLMYGS